jgi:imidazolonepropionase-like amidohydrolase
MADGSGEIVIHAGRLLAEPGQAMASRQSIRIADGRIAEVAAGFIDPPPGARLIDLKDSFVLSGLIDCHVQPPSQLGPGQRLRFVEDSDPTQG